MSFGKSSFHYNNTHVHRFTFKLHFHSWNDAVPSMVALVYAFPLCYRKVQSFWKYDRIKLPIQGRQLVIAWLHSYMPMTQRVYRYLYLIYQEEAQCHDTWKMMQHSMRDVQNKGDADDIKNNTKHQIDKLDDV